MKAQHQNYAFKTKYLLDLEIPTQNVLPYTRNRPVHPGEVVQANLFAKDAEGELMLKWQERTTFSNIAQAVPQWLKEKGVAGSDVTIADCTFPNSFKDIDFAI